MSKYYRALLTINNLIKLFKQRVLSDGGVVESEDCIILDKEASLQLTPNGYSENKLHSIIPSDGSGDFEFTRNSGAMRVNANHLLEESCYNLISYSEGIISTYAINNYVTDAVVSIAGFDNSVYFGDNSLDRGIYKSISTTVVGSYYHFSFFIEMDDLGVPVIGQNSNSGDFSIIFNSNLIFSNHSLELVSGSTYLVKAFGIIQVAGNYFGIGKYTSQSARKFKVSGMQVTPGSTLKPYLKTESRLNIVRIDYIGGATTCPSILIEPQRTNLILYSSDFNISLSFWSGSARVTSNTDIAPDGTLTADRLLADSTSSFQPKNQSLAVPINSTVSASVFVKKTTETIVHYPGVSMVFQNGTGTKVARLILNNKTGTYNLEGVSGIETYVRIKSFNDYWKIEFRATDNGDNNSFQFYIYPAISLDGITISEKAVGSNVFWGAQAELSYFSTSPIPTLASAVTRNADILSETGISHLIGQTEGTIFFDFIYQGVENTYISVSSGNGLNDNIIIGVRSGGAFSIRAFTTYPSTSLDINGIIAVQNTRYKIAFSYSPTKCIFSINGVNVVTTGFSGFSTIMHRFGIDRDSNGSNVLTGRYNDISLFKTPFSEAKCIEKTTL
jgi:hypothetical protein